MIIRVEENPQQFRACPDEFAHGTGGLEVGYSRRAVWRWRLTVVGSSSRSLGSIDRQGGDAGPVVLFRIAAGRLAGSVTGRIIPACHKRLDSSGWAGWVC